jgi:host factor-I protein
MIKNQATGNIQDQFLSRIRRDRIRVTTELVNGRKIEGTLVSFDNFSLLLRGESDQLIYKHAIASLTVAGKLDFEAAGAPSVPPAPRAGAKGTT